MATFLQQKVAPILRFVSHRLVFDPSLSSPVPAQSSTLQVILFEYDACVTRLNRAPARFAGCVMRSPLTISTDISRATADTLRILGHEELIAVNQDPLPTPARLLEQKDQAVAPSFEAWVGPLHDNCSVALIVNLRSGVLRKRFRFVADLGLPFSSTTALSGNSSIWPRRSVSATYHVRDLWNRQELGVLRDGIDVEVAEAHDNALYKLCPKPSH